MMIHMKKIKMKKIASSKMEKMIVAGFDRKVKGAFGGKHVTWARFRKKQDKNATLQDFYGALDLQFMETASQFPLTSSKLKGDDVTTICDDVKVADLKKPIEDSAGRRRNDKLQKEKNKAKTDKTEHGNRTSMKKPKPKACPSSMDQLGPT
ncbi:hypothetical protein Tco_0868531 [Tanacetum coccineum]